MSWYYNSNTGAVSEMLFNPTLHLGTGWHGPFGSEAEAFAFYENGKAANPGWRDPNNPTFLGESHVVPGTGDWTKNLNTWFLRVGEILLGLVLIGVGLAKLTGTTNVIAGAVKTAVKAK